MKLTILLVLLSITSFGYSVPDRVTYLPEIVITARPYEEIECKKISTEILNSNKRDTVIIQSLTVKEFKQRLHILETGGIKNPYSCINQFGYIGKYQISDYYLNRFGDLTKDNFLRNPLAQEKVMNKLCAYYLSEIHRLGLNDYVGRTIGGTIVTVEGLMAGYHLHPVGLKKWLRSNGKYDTVDGNGCPVSRYVKSMIV